jgi:hypothetical protein
VSWCEEITVAKASVLEKVKFSSRHPVEITEEMRKIGANVVVPAVTFLARGHPEDDASLENDFVSTGPPEKSLAFIGLTEKPSPEEQILKFGSLRRARLARRLLMSKT